MELRQLAYFLAIAEERNFTRAAQRIPIAQPAISQQIHRLEAELSETLFVRDRRGARLTPAGEALLPHAQAMLASAGHARDAVAAVSGLLSGRLAIGFVYAGDVAEAIALALERDVAVGRAYNTTDRGDRTFADFADAWRDAGGRTPALRLALPTPFRMQFDPTRAERELGWRNRPLVDALRDTLAREGAS